MTEITLDDLQNKFHIQLKLTQDLLNKPIKHFPDKSKEEILEYYPDYHTENINGKEIMVFSEKIGNHNIELLVDEDEGTVYEFEILKDNTREILFSLSDDGNETIFN